LKGGEQISVDPPEPVPQDIEPEALDISILYQDSDLAIINKPPGMSAHPSGSIRSGTLVNALLHYLDDLSGIGGVTRPGIVHRLDKVTSGLMIIAKNDYSHHHIARQFAERTISKTYLAVVRGHPTERTGEVDEPIARHPTDRKKFTVGPDGKPALTQYEVLQFLEGHALVAAHPQTGRTHQIRVHLSRLGHPIAGDQMYGYRLRAGVLPRVQKILHKYPGILLHAQRIEFQHPRTEEKLSFQVEPPKEFTQVADLLRKSYCSDT